ncbi:hypothetical protein [Lichenihabitans psoromatis]|uniref:hypothetical protein n=1 Tax=Lichenihabitans psoromatis TaxID=2528642 RepID=UPI0010358B23|nr:hypothetical protein [Lichenihabitans psoromatis]
MSGADAGAATPGAPGKSGAPAGAPAGGAAAASGRSSQGGSSAMPRAPAAPTGAVAPQDAAARARMHECGHQWSTIKKAGNAGSMTWKEFSSTCLIVK